MWVVLLQRAAVIVVTVVVIAEVAVSVVSAVGLVVVIMVAVEREKVQNFKMILLIAIIYHDSYNCNQIQRVRALTQREERVRNIVHGGVILAMVAWAIILA